jgi:hypothetical protein
MRFSRANVRAPRRECRFWDSSATVPDSMVTFWPSTYPVSFKPWRNAAMKSSVPACEAACREPITGIAACCARAASGQVTAALPKMLMKSRRLM